MLDQIEKSACLSECGTYRYLLTRAWDGDISSDCWIMLNPSTADASEDDPTIRRCMGFSKGWGAGGIKVVNLFPFRATNPNDLPSHLSDEAMQANCLQVVHSAMGGRIIAAWGSHHVIGDMDRKIMGLLSHHFLMRPVECLGLTKNGFPRHPLYVPADAKPIPYQIASKPWKKRA